MALPFDFAFEGFRIIRERPRLILIWGAVALVGNGLMLAVVIHLAGPVLAQLMPLMADRTTAEDPATVELASKILPAMAAYAAMELVLGAVLATAAARAALMPGDDRLGYLRLGLDELRMLIVHSFMLFMSLFLLLAGAAIGSIGGTAGAATGMFAAFGVILSLRIRLSLNGPQSFDRKTIDLFSSFALTRAEVWRLILGYLMAAALAFVVWYLCGKVIEAIVVLTFGTPGMPDPSSLQAYFTPANAAITVLSGAIVAPLLAAIVYGAPAAAYRALKPSGPA
ncbi:putative membrane protein [Asticcacaulis biprosthecium C19]|uniref:Putative membrane protein n=1 Tax=Asticcacaulis biprosthecium C19 TaxID=715226 RepID=F4QQ41_9CAUL|nr:hypothetical protein [Asticcacaulis biprosthecium]EGF90328.1 putative membrane protein [Asticcacaulis biprosthecium C19]